MRVAVLVGSDSASVRRNVEVLIGIPGVEICGVLMDVAKPNLKRRLKNLWRNSKREGRRYFVFRLAQMMLDAVDAVANRIVDHAEVDRLLHQAFPEEALSLEELAQRHGFPCVHVWNLNSPAGVAALQELNADLGVVMGTRILKPSTFNIPRLGSINVHKGKVPDYRGMPPAFWEIYEGAPTCGVTIHFVNEGLDTGDILQEGEVPVHPLDRPETLLHRLNLLSETLLRDAVAELATDQATPRRQISSSHRTRTRPTREHVMELASRGPHLNALRPRILQRLIKTVVYLGIYALGIPTLLRKFRPKNRAVILLYHRVDDFSADALTTSRRRFAEHLCFLRRHYNVQTTSWLLEQLKNGRPLPPRTVLIHFDDCYASVATGAAPLLVAAGLPATSFISSGFIDTDRKFEHDAEKFPLDYPNLTAEQIRAFAAQGMEVGSHTVNHIDFGRVDPAQAKMELEQSRAHLEALLGTPVATFSFPYGRPENFSAAYAELARESGYEAVFSAYGGVVRKGNNLLDIPRFGVADSHRVLDLVMDLEGLGFESARNYLGN